ncbi:sugar phosphate nucleotidyltransferase [Paenibacillus segetis]|uniref:Mannose-1-phosphate guanylyltransferase n=1 Tax=Paenibacillus segetis TaxID=1325360 RepID=A0ABQ1YFA2_9BACL|nr:sugar phosphate nucleotidyltransferase [Paenibacillus segetis]GGH23915.1 mannose-1-phosphate guanylyltransferase [Paenibacillus segetis]
MRLILLSGGSGKRLWPLSNDYRSKQFIKVMDSENPTDDSQTSMIQRVWARLNEIDLANSAVIAASRVQQEVIQSQLGNDVPLVLEPVKRDTFPAICLASSFLHTKMNVHDDEVIVVMPVDVDADDGFYHTIKQLALEFETSEAKIGLIGLKPTQPSEKFGYILTEPKNTHSTLLKIDRFIEKPSVAEASNLIELGALWNCGVFAFRLGYILKLLEAGNWPTRYEEFLDKYHLMPTISFDYQVVEKEESVVVWPYTGRWNDLGTWNEWTETMPKRLNGKGIISEDSMNTHIINELQIPVIVMGISNAVIAASPDGILVTDKEMSQKLKDVVQSISARPMYEETLYGWYRVIDVANKFSDQQVMTKRVHIWAGKHMSYQIHANRDEIWTIINGQAEVVIDDRRFQANAGDVFHIQVGSKHAIRALHDVDLIEVQMGKLISEDDVIRLDYDWIGSKVSI